MMTENIHVEQMRFVADILAVSNVPEFTQHSPQTSDQVDNQKREHMKSGSCKGVMHLVHVMGVSARTSNPMCLFRPTGMVFLKE